MFKRSLLILFGVALSAQLTGCFFEERDHRDWDHHEHHHEHHDDAGIDVHLRS
jgi:hypothetical protein